MSRTENIYSDKLSLELFREGKRPVDNGVGIEGLLFINTKPTGSTKLAIRLKTGQFTLGEQVNQNPSASVHDKTKYLLFCNNVLVDDSAPVCDGKFTMTNKATITGSFLLDKQGILDKTERNGQSILNQIEKDPNLVVLYDHDTIDGHYNQLLMSPKIMIGANNAFYIELDGVHINARGENLFEALLNYGDGQRLLIDPYNTKPLADLLTEGAITIINRDSKPHTLYIRYLGSDTDIMSTTTLDQPLMQTDKAVGFQTDPDGLGIKITFSAFNKAYATILPWYQYSIGGDAVVGNRYVVEVNGVAYRDTREVTDLNSPTASIQGVVETNPVLATLISVESGGTFNSFTNLSNEYLDIKIYLDETSPYYQNNKTVDTGNNLAGIYKKLDYPYGTTLANDRMRKALTMFDSVYIGVTTDGLSFRLGPNKD